MSVINIDDKGIKVPVFELGSVLNKQQAIVGNYERDLILRTAGNIKIQVGNKFYDLPFSSTTDITGPIVDTNVVLILDTILDLAALVYPGDGAFIYIKETGGFYLATGGTYILLNGSSSGSDKVYLSFEETQNLTGDQKYQLTLNAGTTLQTLSEVSNIQSNDAYQGMVVFDISSGKYYQLKDRANSTLIESWEELFLSLEHGGTIHGDTYLNQSKLHLNSTYSEMNLPINTDTFDGIFMGENDYSEGLGIWRSLNDVIFSNQSDKINGFKFLTRGATDTPYNPLSVSENSVGIGGPIDYSYALNVTGLSNFKNKAVFGYGIKSPDFFTGPNGSGFDISQDSEGKWTLEIDKIITRDTNQINTNLYKTRATDGNLIVNFSTILLEVDLIETIQVNIDASKAGRYSDAIGTVMPLKDKSRLVEITRIPMSQIDVENPVKQTGLFDLAFGIGDKKPNNTLVDYVTYGKNSTGTPIVMTGVANVDNISVYEVKPNVSIDSFLVGDLLLYREWMSDKNEITGIYVEVVHVSTDTIIVYAYNNSILTVNAELIKIGNRTNQECLLQLNGADKSSPYLEVINNIDTFNDYIDNYYYDPNDQETERESENNLFRKDQVRVRMGNLSGITDTNLALSSTLQQGFYSDNAYIKGNFESIRHIMGTQLTYISGVLTIADLETLKGRAITGANGLTGGGNLFAGNIVISHSLKTWVNKPTLTDGDVISNLTIDAYGHPTDWTIRTLTTTDIIEGSEMYYSDARVKAYADTQYVALAGSYANPTWITSLAYSKLTGVPNLGVYELLSNKQNSLTVDGSGNKYPTVDAINTVGNSLIHTTGVETKVGTLTLNSPTAAAGATALTPFIVLGANGGDKAGDTGTQTAGRAGDITIQTGNGGTVSGLTTGIATSGRGGHVTIRGGDGGLHLASSAGFKSYGVGGNIVVQAGGTYGNQPAAPTEMKAGNNYTTGGARGGNIYFVAGYGNNNFADDPTYNGTVFIASSFNGQVRGNAVIGSITDDYVNRLQVTGNSKFTGGVSVTSDVEILTNTSGLILKSPNGTRYRITVANGGTLTITAI